MILIDNRNSTDPYTNLAIEEFVVRNFNCSETDYLLLYVNEPCIVIGKNQSVWKEVNFEYLRNNKLKLCRRITGGGTVYHDEGNLSFSFISKFSDEKVNNYKLFNQPVVDALLKGGVKAETDSRNNIRCKGKKISGSAQFTNRKNIISHGTLLFNADLETLSSCLKENGFEIKTRAVDSVRSPVMNIAEVTSAFSTIADLKKLLLETLKVKTAYRLNQNEWSEIQKLRDEKFNTREWIYGRSPETIIIRHRIEIKVEQGKVVSIKSDLPEYQELVGVEYNFYELKKALEKFPRAYELISELF